MSSNLLKLNNDIFLYDEFVRRRELGFKYSIGYQDKLVRTLTSALQFTNSSVQLSNGGVFNLEFSLDGSILAAACEKETISFYDTFNRTTIKTVNKAHNSCVNCIRFIDEQMFASGSDDNTVKLWDLRNLSIPTRILRGHTNWVKNIEYSSTAKRLITSSFDGSILSWELNNYTEYGVIHEKLFNVDGLMRMKLCPGDSKIICSTTGGFMVLIHNVDFSTLKSDLYNFKPHIYRLMQSTEQVFPVGVASNFLFSPNKKTNQVELISDFHNAAEVISSLQIHPMGWCAVTRNISANDETEWTSVHDIQEKSEEEYLNSYTSVKLSTPNLDGNADGTDLNRVMDIWIGLISLENRRLNRGISNRQRGLGPIGTAVTVINSGIMLESTDGYHKIMKNLPRLTHYIDESNTGKGFIKELCFSSDGRIIASPYNSGVRLFSFNTMCNELSVCLPDSPKRLHTVAHFKDSHKNIVVSCKFNPHHCLLVSGCLGGEIAWYNPVF